MKDPSDAAAAPAGPGGGGEEIGQTPIKSPALKKAQSDLPPEAEFTQVGRPDRLDSQNTLVLGQGSPSPIRDLKDVFDSLAEPSPAKTDMASWLISPIFVGTYFSSIP